MCTKKRYKMKSIAAIVCLMYLRALHGVAATNITRENVTALDRYAKDDGVSKIGFDDVYDESGEEKAEARAKYDEKQDAIGEMIAKLEADDKVTTHDEATRSEEVETSSEEINRSAMLRELAANLAANGGFKSNSQELRGVERRLIPLEDVDSTSSESRSLRQQGVPFFIADDGKSIQLPQSDVIYNTETGEILIRNRVTDKMKMDEVSAEMKAQNSKNGYFNIRPDGIGFKNLQGFVIADNEGNANRPFLFPVAKDSEEDSHEMNMRRRNMDSDEMDDDLKNYQRDAVVIPEPVVALDAFQTPAKDDEPKAADDKDSGDLSTAEMLKTTAFQTSTEVDTPLVPSNVDMTNDDDGKKEEQNSRSGKQVSGNKSQEKYENDSFEKNLKTEEFKAVVTTEKYDATNRWNSREAKDDFSMFIKHDAQVPEHQNDSEERAKAIEEDIRAKISDLDQLGEKTASLDQNMHKQMDHEESDKQKTGEMFMHEAEKEEIEDILSKSATYKDAEINLASNQDILKMLTEEMIGGAILKMSPPSTEAPDPLVNLRSYLEDIYLRGPIAIIVDVEPKNLMRTRELWSSMEGIGGNLNITDAVLFGYDAEGITSMSYHKGNGANGIETDGKSLAKALYGMTTTSKYTSTAGNPRLALNKAAQLLPYDSAIFLFESDRKDELLNVPGPSPRLVKQLLTKRIKLYTVSAPLAWSASAAQASGGAALHPTPSPQYQGPARPGPRELRALSVYYDSSDEEELIFDEQQTLMIFNEVTEPKTFRIPIDSSIKSITVNITETPQYASLEGPEGAEVDLLNKASIGNFSKGSTTLSKDEKSVIVKLVLEAATPAEEDLPGQSEPYQGTWKLTIISNVTYDVLMTAETNLRIMAKLVPTYLDHGPEIKSIKIAVGGTVASIQDEAEVLDSGGRNLTKLVYASPEDSAESDTAEVESLRALESGTVVQRVKVPETLAPGTVFRIQVEGRNDRDEQFIRVSSPLVAPDNYDVETLSDTVSQSAPSGQQVLERGVGSIEEGRAFNSTPNGQQVLLTPQDGLPLTAIQIGSSSRLYGSPGSQIQIQFEVTNNRDNAIYFRFGAKDDQYFLRSMLPSRQWINAGQTANVIVTVGITSNAENNVRDTITFTANGLEPTTLSTYVYVETDGRISSDRSRPSLRHEFRGDCQGHLDSGSCGKHTWGLDIVARDTDSGLMRIGVSPGTVVYQSGFYAGGKEEYRARFTATCCNAVVVISAADVAGNIASYEINVSQYFTPATIAAIALGVLLFIALVVVIILLIRMCLKRRRASRDLPSYQTQRPIRTP